MKKNKVFTQLAILIAIVITVNMISSSSFFRLDFTADKRYTLGKATKDILRDLDNTVTIKAYFSEKLPPQLVSNRRDFEDQLIEYESLSGGNLVYEFVSPDDEEKEREAQANGISPLIINVQENDRAEQVKAYMGVIIQMGDEKEIIPVVQPGVSMEYALTSAIKKLSVQDKPKIAILQGNGEPDLQASSQVLGQLSVLYDVDPYALTDTAEIPTNYEAIAIINPTDTLPNTHLAKLDRYLAKGGGIYLAYNYLQFDNSRNFLSGGKDIGLKGWLEQKGIYFRNAYLIDDNCGAVSVRRQLPPFGIVNQQIRFPYFPVITNFSDHPISKGLESVRFSFINPIDIQVKDSAITYTTLANTSAKSGVVNAPTILDLEKKWQLSDFTDGNQAVAVAAEGPLASPTPAKIVVVANGDYATNGAGNQARQIGEDNVNFAINAIDWLSDDTGLIDLRTKGITSRPLEQLEDGERFVIKYANVFAPIILLLVYAFVRKQQYFKKRQKWIEGDI